MTFLLSFLTAVYHTFVTVLVFTRHYFNTIQNLDGFSTLGLVDGIDYISTSVIISNGKKTEVDVGNIPALNETKLYYTGENTLFSVNKASAIVGSYFTLRGKVDFKTEYKGYVSNLKFIVEIPDNCQLIADSVVVGGTIGQYQVNGNTVIIPISSTNDILHLYITPTVGGDYAPNAFIEFDYSGRTIRQPIGTAPFTTEYFQINVPEKSSQTNVSISGSALPNSNITVFDNGVMVGQTTSNANGTWILDVDLYNPSTYSYHKIYAEIEMDGGIKSSTETKMLKYNINHNEVSKVTMYNSYQNQKIVFDFLNPSTAKKNYTWWSSSYSSFTFTVEFIDNDPDFISDVVVHVITTDKKTVSLPAVFDSRQNLWIATGNFTKSTSIPADVYVEFEMDEKITLDADMISQAIDEIEQFDIGELDGLIDVDVIYDTFESGGIIGSSLSKISIYDQNDNNIVREEFYSNSVEYITDSMLSQIDDSFTRYDDTDGNIYYIKYEVGNDTITVINYDIAKNIRIIAVGYVFDPTARIFIRSSSVKNEIKGWTLFVLGFVPGPIGWIATGISAYDAHSEYKEAMSNLEKYRQCLGEVKYEQAKYMIVTSHAGTQGLNLIGLVPGAGLFTAAGTLATEEVNKSFNKMVGDVCKNTHQVCGNGCLCGCGSSGGGSSSRGSGTVTSPNIGSTLTPKIDPSGYIYEAVASNRLQGVTVTAFHKENGITRFWDATEYDEVNPLITDNIGWYAWDVPIGLWQVKAELSGYQTTYSEWLSVPPPQLDVNLAMVSYIQPYVTNVNAYQDYIEIVFSKYMNISTLNLDNIVMTQSGIPVPGHIELIDSEENPMKQTEKFASKVKFVFDTPFAVSDIVQLSISGNVESYADAAMGEDYIANMVIAVEVQTLQAANLTMDFGAVANIEAVLSPYEAAAGKKIIVHSESSQIAIASNEVIVKQDGTALIPVTAQLPGTAYFTLELEGTDLKTEIIVTIGMPIPTQITYTATQVSGIEGTADSTGIQIIFNQSVTGLTANRINITNDTGTVVKGTLSGSGTTYILSLTNITAAGNIIVSIVDFSTFQVTTNPQSITVYKNTTLTNIQAVAADKEALTFDVIKGTNLTPDNIIENLTLPTIGVNGSTISWSSNNTVIVSSTGAVTRPAYNEGDKQVILTATITSGNISGTVQFTLTVSARPENMYAIQVTTGTGGTVFGSGTFATGTQVTLTATPNDGYSFDGWYENDKLISKDETLIFTAEEDRELEARFTIATIIKGDLNDDGEANIEDAKLFLEYLVGNYELSEAQLLAVKAIVNESDSAIKQLRAFLNFLKIQ